MHQWVIKIYKGYQIVIDISSDNTKLLIRYFLQIRPGRFQKNVHQRIRSTNTTFWNFREESLFFFCKYVLKCVIRGAPPYKTLLNFNSYHFAYSNGL